MPLTIICKQRSSSSSVHSSSKRVDNGTVHNPTGVYVNSSDVKRVGVTVPMERPSTTALMMEPIRNINRKLVAGDHDMLVRSFLTKFPHYQFVQKVYHTRQTKVKYWFKNTKNNVTSVFTKDEAEYEMRKAGK